MTITTGTLPKSNVLAVKLLCDGGKFNHIMNNSEKVFYGGIRSSHGKLAGGSGASPSLLYGISIMHCEAIEGH